MRCAIAGRNDGQTPQPHFDPVACRLWPCGKRLGCVSDAALGVEVWPIHTVQFSNHTGYGAWKGRVFDAPMIEEIVEGIADRGVLGHCDGVISGYIGSSDIGQAILDTAARVKAANRNAIYACDPGDRRCRTRDFVRPGIPEFMRGLAFRLPIIITPTSSSWSFWRG